MQASQALTESEPLIKDWLMKRNCSVLPRQFVGFYLSLSLVFIAIATSLFLNGAWLVLPFTGIELTVVGVAFVIYARWVRIETGATLRESRARSCRAVNR